MILHRDIKIPNIKVKTAENGIRVYETPEGLLYPSITTVLSILSEKDIQSWKERVGTKTAEKITRQAAKQGTSLHELVEKYLNNEEVKESVHFRAFKSHLSKITEIYCQEKTVWSNNYQIAGRTDCVCLYDGKPTVVDFKTSAKKKKIDWLENYFIQGTFYAEAFEERTGIQIENICIIMLLKDDLKVDIFETPKESYIDKLWTVRDMYRSVYGI